MPKPRSREEKELIQNLLEELEKEKSHFKHQIKIKALHKDVAPLNYRNVAKHTALTLKISKRCVHMMRKENKRWGNSLSPKTGWSGRKSIEIDSFTEGVIRRAVLQAFSRKEYPTIDSLHRYLQSDGNFPRMCRSTLYKIMRKQLKFKVGKFEGKPIPMDRPDIAAHRAKYLRQIKKYRAEGRQIYYQDENWVNESLGRECGSHIPLKEVTGMSNSNVHRDPWLRGVGYRFRDELIGGIASKPTGAGKRIIMINVGSEDGSLGLGKEFVGKKDCQDYHSEMNSAYFHEWIQEVISCLPDKAVLVLDQATYHRTTTEETRNPTTSYRKAELVTWLEQHKVPIPANEDSFWCMRRVELLELAKKNKIPTQLKVEKIMEDKCKRNANRDLKLLWLPVAHCELNPIELVWAAVKAQVRSKNTSFKMKDLLPIVQETLRSDYINQLWASCCCHVVELEDHVMKMENLAETFVCAPINPIIISLGDSSSDSMDSETESD